MQWHRQQQRAKIVLLEDGTVERLPHMIPPMTAHANSAEKERMHQINLAQEEVARTALMASTNPTTLLLNINVRPVAKDKLPLPHLRPSVPYALQEHINHKIQPLHTPAKHAMLANTPTVPLQPVAKIAPGDATMM